MGVLRPLIQPPKHPPTNPSIVMSVRPDTDTHTHTDAFVEHLAFVWFVPVMGWGGLGLAWLRSTADLGLVAHQVALACASVASLLWLAIALFSVKRCLAFPQAVSAELQHPVKHGFVSALPLSMLLLAALWQGLTQHFGPAGHTSFELIVIWYLGAVGQLASTVWVIVRWLRSAKQGGTPLAALSPVLLLPLAGNLLVPLAGVPLGFVNWSAVQAGVGLLLWPVVLGLLWRRRLLVGPLPARMAPGWFILVVPPSVLTLALGLWPAPEPVLWASWCVAVLFLLGALSQAKAVLALPFGMPHWGLSFPVAAFTSASISISMLQAGRWLWPVAIVALAISSVVVLWLTLFTLRGLRRGEMLRPDH